MIWLPGFIWGPWPWDTLFVDTNLHWYTTIGIFMFHLSLTIPVILWLGSTVGIAITYRTYRHLRFARFLPCEFQAYPSGQLKVPPPWHPGLPHSLADNVPSYHSLSSLCRGHFYPKTLPLRRSWNETTLVATLYQLRIHWKKNYTRCNFLYTSKSPSQDCNTHRTLNTQRLKTLRYRASAKSSLPFPDRPILQDGAATPGMSLPPQAVSLPSLWIESTNEKGYRRGYTFTLPDRTASIENAENWAVCK